MKAKPSDFSGSDQELDLPRINIQGAKNLEEVVTRFEKAEPHFEDAFWEHPDYGDNSAMRSGAEPFWMRPPLIEVKVDPKRGPLDFSDPQNSSPLSVVHKPKAPSVPQTVAFGYTGREYGAVLDKHLGSDSNRWWEHYDPNISK